MKMKRLLALLLALIMCFMMVACGNDSDKDDGDSKKGSSASRNEDSAPLLYRVTDDDGNVIWLFGSIHVGREDYYPLPDYVLDAFDGSDSLAVELDVIAFEKDTRLQFDALSAMVYNDGTKIKDHISAELYEEAVELLTEYDYYVSLLDMYCPAFWSSALDSLLVEEIGVKTDLGIDRHLINRAYDADKEIIDIESAKFQYEMLADFDDEVQALLLESSVESFKDKEKTAAELKEMMDLWASGDEEAFARYLTETDDSMTASEKRAYERYQQALVTDRNLNMADFAEEALLSGDEVFICVGAAHIVGDGALADLLDRRGYTVELITK